MPTQTHRVTRNIHGYIWLPRTDSWMTMFRRPRQLVNSTSTLISDSESLPGGGIHTWGDHAMPHVFVAQTVGLTKKTHFAVKCRCLRKSMYHHAPTESKRDDKKGRKKEPRKWKRKGKDWTQRIEIRGKPGKRRTFRE